MKTIEPYNEVWLDCYNNLKLSLLRYIDEENVIRGLNNNYKYKIFPHKFEECDEFYCITEDQTIIFYEEFSDIERVSPKTEEEFYDVVKNQLSMENGFVLMRTDLFDWLEGNICWQRYHWDHYSLLVDFDEVSRQFTVFDEKGGNYVKFFVPESKLYKCLFYSDKHELLRLVTLKPEKVRVQSWDEIKSNAQTIIDSIDKCMECEFWTMEEYVYDGGHYKDLNGVYLQKIEGRHQANALLMKMLEERGAADGVDFAKYRSAFEGLAVEWGKIRMALFVLYLRKKNREQKIRELNEMLRECLQHEKDLWLEIMR